MRIVSLLPAATELCYALGLADDVVGVSPECDFPPGARTKPVISRSVLAYEGKSSRETSRMVGERLEAGGALYQVDESALRSADPDLILTQGLCEVCAPAVGDVEEVARRLSRVPSILSLDPHRLDDSLTDMERVARRCGVEDRAAHVIESARDRIGRVAKRAAAARVRPKVMCLEWFDPLFVAGHWVPEMVDLAGGTDVLAEPGEASHRVDPKEIVMASPDVAILMPCGFHLDRTDEEASNVTGNPWWGDLPATRSDRAWLVDGSSFFNRPGPRLVDGLEILAHILHPDLFPQSPALTAAKKWGR